jgi:streptogramin lyase
VVSIEDGKVVGHALDLPELVDMDPERPVGGPTALAVTPDGAVWVGGRDFGFVFPSDDHGFLFRHANGSSELVRPLGDGMDAYVADLAVGPDGALWALMLTEDDSHLGRLDGDTWSIYSTADGLPAVGAGFGERMAVGADGRVWFTIFGSPDEADPEPPKAEGLAVFDGQGFTRYLVGRSVNDMAIAPDGSVWTSTDDGFYVITPQGVAGTD